MQVMKTSVCVLGLEQPSTLISTNNLTHTFKSQDRNDEAIHLMAFRSNVSMESPKEAVLS